MTYCFRSSRLLILRTPQVAKLGQNPAQLGDLNYLNYSCLFESFNIMKICQILAMYVSFYAIG